MEDTISRKTAIEAFDNLEWFHQNANKDMVSGANPKHHQTWYKEQDVYKTLEQLPSVQPEIVRCKDCRHRDPEDHKCDCGHDIIWQLPRDDKWYCADAERRTDGVDS